MYGERVASDNEGLACDGLASFPVEVGDYVELHSGVLGKVTHINQASRAFSLAYLWRLGVTKHLYQQLRVEAYRRHATVNEITALKLMGLI